MNTFKLIGWLTLPFLAGCSGMMDFQSSKQAHSNFQPKHAVQACAPASQVGQWLIPTDQDAKPVMAEEVLKGMKQQQVVLLGEQHDSAEDHRWQLHMLSQLHSQHANMAVGFEMFPRRLQGVLNRWVAGELSESEFRKQSEWDQVWGYEWDHYAPLFHYARMNRMPMLALNVERSLVSAVGQSGWDAVPLAQREGVTTPAAPQPAYLNALKSVFGMHGEKKIDEAAFSRFVQAQTVWDRAMAMAIADHLKQHPQAQVVGIMGSGHVRNGYGVAHQLKSLGVEHTGLLMTWEHTDACHALGDGLADAIYLAQSPKNNPPRMGVGINELPQAQGLEVTSITPGSIAEAAELKLGDVIVEVAGQAAKNFAVLRTAIQRQSPGTWLPLKVKREDKDLELIARFPVQP